MIGISLELDSKSRRELARLQSETPRTFRAAHGSAARRARNRLRKLLRLGGGMYGVKKLAPHHEMSDLIRPGQQMLGKLADKEVIVCYRRGEGQIIGWVEKLAAWASALQGDSRYAMDTGSKRFLHRMYPQLKGYHIPEIYDRPSRLVISPFSRHLAQEFPPMVVEMFNKRVARLLKKGKAIT